MIVRMKKVSVLLYHHACENFLASLQELGVVHIVEHPEKDTSSLQEIATRIKECERMLAWLQAVQQKPLTQRSDKSPEAVIAAFEEYEAERMALDLHLQNARRDEAALRPWGDFDPDLLTRLRAAGVVVKFYELSQNTYATLSEQEVMLVPIAQQRTSILCVLIAHGEVPPIDAEEILLPATSLGAVQKRIEELHAARARVDQQMHDLAAYLEVLQHYCADQKNRFAVLSAALDLAPCVGGKIISLTGWCPAPREKQVAAFLEKFPAWCAFSEPSAEDDVPVLLHNNRFARLFEPITRLYSLPNYHECDPTPFLAPFFALFVGLCIGDVGYGALILLLSLLAYGKVKGEQRSYALLGAVLGGMTVLCGCMLNSFFGEPLCAGLGIPREAAVFPSGAQYCLLSPYKNAAGITEFPVMSFSLLVGFVQILMALLLQLWVHVRQGGVVQGCKPLSFIMLFFGVLVWAAHTNALNLNLGDFTVGNWKVGRVLLAVPLWGGKALLGGGLVLLLFGANIQKRVFIRPLLGVWELYQFATGLLGDLLSYIRLFALGLCSGLLGSTFNALAMGFIRRDDQVQILFPWIFVTVFLLVGGHSLNFVLSLVGSFVHPIRLTFVEFFKNLDFRWGGKPFLPFCRISPKTKQ